jgi:group I intron endonuclease
MVRKSKYEVNINEDECVRVEGKVYGRIYYIRNIINGKGYVGQTKMTARRRLNQHFYEAFDKNSKGIIHRALRCHGLENFEFKVVEDVAFIVDGYTSLQNLNAAEEKWIAKLNTFISDGYGYNCTRGAVRGFEFSDETREKLSQTHKGLFDGDKNPNYGKRFNIEINKKECIPRLGPALYGSVCAIICKETGKVFVGKTVSEIHKFFARYLCGAISADDNMLISRIIKEYGPEGFEYKLLEECFCKEELYAATIRWIIKLNALAPSGLNSVCCKGMISDDVRKRITEQNKGRKFTLERRAIMSKKAKENNAWRGKHHSEETKKLLSQQKLGRKQPPVTFEALRISNLKRMTIMLTQDELEEIIYNKNSMGDDQLINKYSISISAIKSIQNGEKYINLIIVTPEEFEKKGRRKKWSGKSGKSALTREQALMIKINADGLSKEEFSELFGVNARIINGVIIGRTWNSLEIVDPDQINIMKKGKELLLQRLKQKEVNLKFEKQCIIEAKRRSRLENKIKIQEENSRAKEIERLLNRKRLTEEQILEIRINKMGLSIEELSIKYNFSQAGIRKIKNNKIYVNVQPTNEEQFKDMEVGKILFKENKKKRSRKFNQILMLEKKPRCAKLTIDQVRFIRAHQNDYSRKELREMFNVSDETIRVIIKNQSWKDV